MKVLSLFDGMACGYLAMQDAGIKVDSYDAFEIDGTAIKTAVHNFPDIVEHGDVFEGDFTKFKGYDILIGGSPCTYWSIAQKNNRETEASGLGWELFSQYVRALNEIKPRFFIYENNKSMSKAIRDSITETFGFDAVCINSALVSAQNRQRLYWVGKRNEDDTYSKVDVQQPKDRGILLRDILKKGCKSMIAEPLCPTVTEKSHTVNAGYSRVEVQKWYDRVYSGTTKKQQHDYIAESVNTTSPKQVGAMPRPNGELSTSQAFRVYDTIAKSVTINAGGGGAGGKTGLYAIPVEFENGIPIKAISSSDGKTYTVYSVSNGIIVIKGKKYPIKLKDGYYIIRKLSVNECKRLQTVPDWYEFPTSNTQAYKMLGNGWTVAVISHILKAIKEREI